MQEASSDENVDLCSSGDQQDYGDNPEKDIHGVKFWSIWLVSGFIITVLYFALTYSFSGPKSRDYLENSKRTVQYSQTRLSAFIIYVNEGFYNSEIVIGWKNLLQHWTRYSPCNASSKPINWECSNVDLIFYGNKTDLSQIMEDLRDYWLMANERNRLCFRDFYILDFKTGTYNSTIDYYFASDLTSTPVTSNWLNKIIVELEKGIGADFIGSYNHWIGIYKSKVYPIFRKQILNSKSLMKPIRMVSNDKSAIFYNRNY
jgi:hypothetical protein